MEYVEGLTLHELFCREGALNPEWVLSIGDVLADALNEAHAAGIVHRDLKPANILVREADGSAKIADFGIARVNLSELTQPGMTYGSPAYMAPERIRGEPADARSDLFSLAVILYEAVAGQRPFCGENFESTCYAIVHDDPVPVRQHDPGLAPAFDSFFRQALAKEPGERFQDGAAFRAALESVRHEQVLFSSGATQAVSVPDLGAAPEPTPDLPILDLPELDGPEPDDRPMTPPRGPMFQEHASSRASYAGSASRVLSDLSDRLDATPFGPGRGSLRIWLPVAGGALLLLLVFLFAGSGSGGDPAAEPPVGDRASADAPPAAPRPTLNVLPAEPAEPIEPRPQLQVLDPEPPAPQPREVKEVAPPQPRRPPARGGTRRGRAEATLRGRNPCRCDRATHGRSSRRRRARHGNGSSARGCAADRRGPGPHHPVRSDPQQPQEGHALPVGGR